MISTEYTVTGMTCAHCELSVREEVGELTGIDAVQVDAGTGTLVVTAAGEIDDSAVLAAVAEAGYSAVRAS